MKRSDLSTKGSGLSSEALAADQTGLQTAVQIGVQAADQARGQSDIPTNTALFLSAFFDELIRLGVRDVVVSPGSRSTPLSMLAYKSELKLHIDVDERGAAFFALGLAKASGRVVCTICTSGTAVANYYPAVLEAEISRVPLMVLTGDRPPLLQNLGAPQTCDQIKAFSDHVRFFQQMPLPGSKPKEIAFARQMALAAFSAAVGLHASLGDEGDAWYGCISNAGPVHLNFPFEEPLAPNLEAEGLFSCGRRLALEGPRPLLQGTTYPDAQTVEVLHSLLRGKRSLVLCGEGSCVNSMEAELLLLWAKTYQLPLVADPLSNLRSYEEALVIDNYDNIFRSEHCSDIDLVIRFGRYPISKACFSALNKTRPMQIVVDAFETRDFNAASNFFVCCTPAAFVASLLYASEQREVEVSKEQQSFANSWIQRNKEEAKRIAKVNTCESGFEGVFIYQLLKQIPEGACLFSASSMSIRMIDTFYLKRNKQITLLCNRGLNGIDGSLSSAVGASHCFEHTTFLVGDLAFLHDLSALALQGELLLNDNGGLIPNIIVVVVNNHGGGIFEMLPQRSDDPYFKRLFLTPQELDIAHIAAGFAIPYAQAQTVKEFETAYQGFLRKAGMHIIEVSVPSSGLKERYGDFLS